MQHRNLTDIFDLFENGKYAENLNWRSAPFKQVTFCRRHRRVTWNIFCLATRKLFLGLPKTKKEYIAKSNVKRYYIRQIECQPSFFLAIYKQTKDFYVEQLDKNTIDNPQS